MSVPPEPPEPGAPSEDGGPDDASSLPEDLDKVAVDTSKTGPLAWMAQNPVASNLIMAFLIIGGIMMLPSIKQEVFPEFELDLVLVNVPYPGASPTEVEQGVALAVEEAVQGLEGIKELRSTVSEGNAVIAIELRTDAIPDRALSDIKAAVDRITSFPEDVERPVVSLALMRRQVASLMIYGDRSEDELRTLAEQARDALVTDPEISYVELGGVRAYEVSVEVPTVSTRRYGLGLQQIAARIRAASVDVPGGGVRTDSGEVLLRTTERRRTGEEFADIVLLGQADGTEVRVRDVATVVDGFAESDLETYYRGERAAIVKVFRVGDETPIEVSDALKRFIADNEASLPAGVRYDIWSDQSEIYKDRIDLLMRNAYIGLFLVLFTLGLFLEIRLAFWVTMGIPISFIGSLLFLPVADVSINMISLFAFIVTLGMVVDDAIVVGEAVYKHRMDGLGALDAAIAGVREVAGPVVFAIATSCLAFAPMLFVPGVMGKFFKVIPIIVITVLLISLVESLFILPAHLAHSKGSQKGVFGVISRQQQRFSRFFEWLIEKTYVPTVRIAVANRYLTLAVCVALLISTVGLIAGGRVGFTFMPKIESDVISAKLTMPFGTSIDETRLAQERLEAGLHEALAALGSGEEDVRGVFAQAGGHLAGRGPGGGQGSTGSHLADVSVYLVPLGDRDFTAADLTARWRAAVGEIPGAENLLFQFSSGPADGNAIDIELSHPDMETLEIASARLASDVATYGGVKDIDDGFAPGKLQLDFRIRPEARGLGLTENDVARQVRAAFFGAEAVRQQRGRDEVRTYVRRPLAERESMYDVETLLIRTPNGGELPLGQAAEIVRGRSYTQILRVDQRRVVRVTADVEDGVNATEIVRSLEEEQLPALLAEVPGLRYRLTGEQKSQAESISALGTGMMMAMVAIFGLLAIAFKSYVQPLIVMSAIPFGMIGAVMGHMLMGYDLSLMSMMGIVALSGVVVNDSLILVDAANSYHRGAGLGLYESIVAAGERRFRPILLTSLTTFFGLAPMITETSMQARFLIPMAISLGFGVLFATFIILVLVPSLYIIVQDVKVGAIAAWRFVYGPLDAPSGRDAPPVGGE